MKRTLFTLLSVAALLAGCGQPAAPLAPGAPAVSEVTPTPSPPAAFEQAPCPFEIPEGFNAGQDVLCGFVSVPQEHANPQGAKIRLGVAILKSTSPSPAPDPLVIEAGGPGVSTLASAPTLLQVSAFDLRAQRDIVLVEQRGTRYSEPFLFCDELQKLAKDELSQPIGTEEKQTRQQEALTACRQRLEAQGINLAAYNSLENAADIPLALTALGYEQFNFYGISYATLLAQHLMRDYPNRLRSVILDASAPLSVDYVAQAPQNAQRAFDLLFEHCAADPTCQAAYPTLEADFYALVETWNTHPRPIRFNSPEAEVSVSGDRLVWMLYQHIYHTTTAPMLPMWIDALVKNSGDHTLITGLGIQYLSSTITNGMSYSVRCADEAHRLGASLEADGVHPQVAATMREAMDIQAACGLWEYTPLPERALAPLNSAIPTLILAGELDPVTPPANAAVMAQGLTRSQVYTFPGLGHGAFLKHPCPTEIVLAFLEAPTQAPDSACITSMGVEFVIPSAETHLEAFTDAENGIQGVLPVGWSKVQAGLYLYVSASGSTSLLEVSRLPDKPLDEQIASWLPGLGITQFPVRIGTRTTAAFTWEIYAFPGNIGGIGPVRVDVAIAKSETGVYYVGLYTPASEYDLLHEQVFLPVVDALEILK